MQILEYKNKRVFLGVVKFKTKDWKYLGILLIFTPIPLMPKSVVSKLVSTNMFKGELESVQHSHTKPFHSLTKFCMFLSL